MTDKKEVIKRGPGRPPKQAALPATITPPQMLQMVVEQGGDLDKIEKFMNLAAAWEEREAKKAYTIAMSDFRRDCPIITRTRQGYNDKFFAGLAETIDEIKDLLAANGLSHSWVTTQEGDQVTVKCCITHIAGHTECTQLTAGPDKTGNKNSIQAIGSTVSYLQRYTLFAILGLASKDMDDDGQAGDPVLLITEDQVNQLHSDAIENEVYNGLMNWLKATLKVNSLNEIRADKFKMVEDRLKAAIDARSKK